MTRKSKYALLLVITSLASLLGGWNAVLAMEADQVSDFFITGMPPASPTSVNISNETTKFASTANFSVDLGIPNNNSEDPAKNVKSQSYTFSTDSDGTIDYSSISLPIGFQVTDHTPTSVTITKDVNTTGNADNSNSSADLSLSASVTYTSAGSKTMILSGVITFLDGSSLSTTSLDPSKPNHSFTTVHILAGKHSSRQAV